MKNSDLATINRDGRASSGATVRKASVPYIGRPFVKKVVDTSFFNSVLDRFEQKSDSENLPVALFGK